MFEYEALKLLGILLALIFLFIFLPPRRFYSFFFVVLLITEFYYIRIGQGTARVYQFLAVLIVLLLSRHVPRLFSSNLFIVLLGFVSINVCAIILSGTPGRALVSALSFCANIAIALATALILITEKVKLPIFNKIILSITLIGILWESVQIVSFSLIGINLSLSPEQAIQISAGFGPGFRTEANTFAKYMVFPLLFFLPAYVNRTRNFGWIFVAFIIGFLLNFTRSAIYGIMIALPFIFFWYVRRRGLLILWTRSLKITVVVVLSVFLMLTGIISNSKYAQHKMINLFSQEEILEGQSGGGRLKMMALILDDSLSDIKKMIIGRGWGQNRYYYQGRPVIAGGGDLANVLTFSGILGLVAYLLFIFVAAKTAWKAATTNEDRISSFAEGVLFAMVGMFCTGQMSGYLITPEYWLLIGLILYLSLSKKSASESR